MERIMGVAKWSYISTVTGDINPWKSSNPALYSIFNAKTPSPLR
jgi:hypothetical protein